MRECVRLLQSSRVYHWHSRIESDIRYSSSPSPPWLEVVDASPRFVKEQFVDVVVWQPLTKAHTILVKLPKAAQNHTDERCCQDSRLQAEAEKCLIWLKLICTINKVRSARRKRGA